MAAQPRDLLTVGVGLLLAGRLLRRQSHERAGPHGQPALKLTWMSFAGFAQDDWRVTPKVVVNLGLRYQYITPMKDANNNIGTFDPNIGMVQQTSSSSLWSGDHRDFEPRLGVAWDVTGKGTTVIRAGASLIHEAWTEATFTGQFQLQNAVDRNFRRTHGSPDLLRRASRGKRLPFHRRWYERQWLRHYQSQPPLLERWSGGRKCWLPRGPDNGFAGQRNAEDAETAWVQIPPRAISWATVPNLRAPFVVNYNLGITHHLVPTSRSKSHTSATRATGSLVSQTSIRRPWAQRIV